MTLTYKISGMTCEGCKAKVSYLISQMDGVSKVDIDLNAGEAVLQAGKHVSVVDVANALKEFPKYKVGPESPRTDEILAGENKTWWQTYKPLLTIFFFILGVSILTSFQGQFMTMHFMGTFMAGFFLVFSFFKMLDLNGFASSYSMYDLLARRLPVYGYVYPFIELALGVSYLTGFQPINTNIATIVVMGFSSLGVIQTVINKKKIRCACLGAVFNLPMSTVTIVEDLLMVGMSAVMILI